MKKILFILFILFTVFIYTSCATVYGPNMDKLSQQLELGMSRQEAISIMGKDFFVESAHQEREGKMEVLHFKSLYYSEYLLYFLNGELVEFHRYIKPVPMQQEIRVVKE